MRTAFAVFILAAIALFLAVPASGALAQSSCINEGDTCSINGVVGRCVHNPDCPQDGSNPTCDANICAPAPANPGASCTGDNYGAAGICKAAGSCASGNTDTSPNCTGGLICCSNSSVNPLTGGTNTSGTHTGGTNTGTTLMNPLKSGTSLEGLLNSILDFVIRIGTVVIILMIVYVGFKFVTAQGNESAIRDARQALLWTVVGALILLGAKAISIGLQATVQSLGG